VFFVMKTLEDER